MRALRLDIDMPAKVGMSAVSSRSLLGSRASSGGAPPAPFQPLMVWQPPQSPPPVAGCMKPGTGKAAKGAATSWHMAQLLATPAWSYATLSLEGWQERHWGLAYAYLSTLTCSRSVTICSWAWQPVHEKSLNVVAVDEWHDAQAIVPSAVGEPSACDEPATMGNQLCVSDVVPLAVLDFPPPPQAAAKRAVTTTPMILCGAI